MIKLVFLLSFLLHEAFAHQTGLSYINITESSESKIDILYQKPLEDIKAKDLQINYPQGCEQITQRDTKVEDGFIIYSYKLWCGTEGLKSKRIWIEGLEPLNRGVLMYYTSESTEKKALLKASNPYFDVDGKSSSFSLFLEYMQLGIEHILSGYDHLLFVFALLMIAKNKRVLIIAISAFTVSHSITLLFSIFELMDIPVLFVEASIALSIVFLARELLVYNENSLTRKHLEIIAFIFGLLHGFGFSNVLRTIGLPQDDIVLALLSFNIGIEIGQLFFIFCMGVVLFVLQRFFSRFKERSTPFIAYAIGAISFFWVIQRVVLF